MYRKPYMGKFEQSDVHLRAVVQCIESYMENMWNKKTGRLSEINKSNIVSRHIIDGLQIVSSFGWKLDVE